MLTLSVENINKTYDSFRAVKDVSFSIEEGQIFGLLGPNGAGKTTTMRMIMNIIIPDSGIINIFGQPFREEHKNLIGYLPEERGLYPKMKLIDHLQFFGEMKGLTASKAKKVSTQWLQKFDLTEWLNKKVQDLSKGMQQKVQFIGTILHSPDLLILDEPFSGLDPINTKFLKDIIIQLKNEGKTIILSTHLMDQAEKLIDDICLINHGSVVLSGNLQENKKKYSHNSVILEYSGDGSFIDALPIVESTNDYGNYMEIHLNKESTSGELFKLISNSDLEIRKFEASETTLNQIFIDIAGKSNNAKNN